MDQNLLTQIIIMVVLLMMSGYFSATETAFSSVNKTRLKALAEKENKKAELALSLAEQYDKLISTILIGNNIVNIALASMGTVLFVHLYGDIGATISTAVITIAVLIFGEISPKSIAKDCPEKFAMFSAPIIRSLIWILTPVNFLFSSWKKLLAKMLKVQEDTKMSQEELLMLVDEVEQDGSLDENESELIRNAIEFNERTAEDILTHRTDLVTVSVDADKEELAELFHETKFSRLLVYEENIDNIVGVVNQKDFYTGLNVTDKSIKEIMTPPVFVISTEKINELLHSLQMNKSHVAVVLDEYGGTYGIVTMEDILEELVGEIWDEHDEVVVDFKKISKDTYKVDCSVDLEEFCEFFDIKTDSEVVSLGGWVMEQLGYIPRVGDSFEYDHYDIKVTEIDIHRVEQIEITDIGIYEETEE